MSEEQNQVYGLPIFVSWDGVDLDDWKNLPDDDPNDEFADDEERETPPDVISALGFDPAKEGWE